jgi:hypothetical protein
VTMLMGMHFAARVLVLTLMFIICMATHIASPPQLSLCHLNICFYYKKLSGYFNSINRLADLNNGLFVVIIDSLRINLHSFHQDI